MVARPDIVDAGRSSPVPSDRRVSQAGAHASRARFDRAARAVTLRERDVMIQNTREEFPCIPSLE